MKVRLSSVPDDKAIAFLKQKMNLTTKAWDDVLGEVHAKSFTVAGAVKLALLKDLRHAVIKAIEEGESIGQFRNRFDEIVARHGWAYKGKQGWRTRVIYDNNLRSARMAGRWDQIQGNKDKRPYLMYRTVGDGRVRKEHSRWDDTVLPVDDPFWNTHYPPNGWGCRCDVRTLSEDELERKGLTVSQSPAITTEARQNARTGEYYGEVPEGIDTGWDYNVGKAWLAGDKAIGDHLLDAPRRIQEQFNDPSNVIYQRLNDAFSRWAIGTLSGGNERDVMVSGYLSGALIQAVRSKGAFLRTATITTDRKALLALGDTLDIDAIAKLSASLQSAKAVLWDRQERQLVYVLDDVVVAVSLDVTQLTNQVVVPVGELPLDDGGRFEVLEGKL